MICNFNKSSSFFKWSYFIEYYTTGNNSMLIRKYILWTFEKKWVKFPELYLLTGLSNKKRRAWSGCILIPNLLYMQIDLWPR